MIQPVVALGNKVLRKTCLAIERESDESTKLINDLWETLRKSDGVGLAAPQIGKALQAFIVDTSPVFMQEGDEEKAELFPEGTALTETFINATIINKSDKKWTDYEGCLSIPEIYEQVERSWTITINYLDAQFQSQEKTFSGYNAKVIQHEFDHTQGKLFIDYISPLRRKLLRARFEKIIKGKVKTSYAMFVTNK